MSEKKFKICGRDLTFEEVEAILREYFSQREGIPYLVEPQKINRELFKESRMEKSYHGIEHIHRVHQEEARKFILDGFKKMDQNPERYKQFKILIPEYYWEWTLETDYEEIAENLGGHIADEVELALYWAQQISNGEETWESLSEDDSSKYFRIIKSSDDGYMLVGGSNWRSAWMTYLHIPCGSIEWVHSVPLVIL